MKLLIENWRKFLCEADEYDIDIRTAQSGYTPPPPPEEPTGGDPKTLAYFIFDGENSSARMQDGTTVTMDFAGEFQRIAREIAATLGPEDRDLLRGLVDRRMSEQPWLGYESKLADLLKQDDLTKKQLAAEDLPASVLIKFPDGTERKYNKNTGEEGEEF
jgi:hypothetical protein